MITRCDEWLSLPIYGDGRQVRDWIHVDDHCRAIAHVIDKGTVGETYLVGASQQVENISIVDEICDIMDELKFTEEKHCALIDFVQDRPGHDRRYAVDWSKLADLGWQPQVDFSAGLRDTVQWYLNNRDWVQTVSNKIHHRRQGTV
jgi:dTDP-glucose 4,6-dehydratase